MGPRIKVWLLLVCTQILVTVAVTDSNDLAVLNALKSSWQNLPPNWSGSDPCGSGWEGIRCNNSRVTSLILAGMGVNSTQIGDIPSLSALQYLDLSNNKGLRGTLPSSIDNLRNLTTLILVGCSFFGPIPESIGSLPQLVFLGLNNNSFNGPIPPTIGYLSNLSWLDLSHNRLHGSIPISSGTEPGLDMLIRARHFHLSMNQLSGTIQPQLFRSSMCLIHVSFDNNMLSGDIPPTLGLVGTLLVVRLDWNSLSGSVPQNLSNLANITGLYLSNNNLTGPVPNLGGLNFLSYVDMSNNSFDVSDVPTWFTGLQSLTTLKMERTQLQGEIPFDLFRLPQLETVVLCNNRLNGTLDIGSSYSSNLILDLRNNSIINFRQRTGYNMNLTLVDNPICNGAEERYCMVQRPNAPNIPQIKSCNPVVCSSNRILSPNCECSYPYKGTIHFYSFSFSNLGNSTYYRSLAGSLLSAFLHNGLPVDSIYISDPTIDVYNFLQLKLQIFPSDEERFNRSGVSRVGSLLNRNNFRLEQYFGPSFFIDESYCCFSGKNKTSNIGIIVGATIGSFVLVLLLLCAGLYAYNLKRRADRLIKQNTPFASWDPAKSSGSVPHLQGAKWFSFDDLKNCTNNFSESNIIGHGGYGKVYRGTLATEQAVAIKRAQEGSLQGAHEFKTEIELLSRIHHKNVVSLVGFCYEQGEQMLVYEYLSNGTLKGSLSGASRIQLSWIKRLEVAFDSARGLAYLHELTNPPIIHRDVKSNNILLDDHLNAKVADFGLSKPLSDISKGYVTTQVKGTMGYMDPEYYMTQQLTEKSDVYSFGIVMLELITARKPIDKGRHIVREVKEASNNLHKILDPTLGVGPTLPGLDKFLGLALSCVEESGADRPTMGEVVREIEGVIQLAQLNLNAEPQSVVSTSSNRDLYDPYFD